MIHREFPLELPIKAEHIFQLFSWCAVSSLVSMSLCPPVNKQCVFTLKFGVLVFL